MDLPKVLSAKRTRLLPAEVEHAEAYADAALESDGELSQWSRTHTGPRDRAHYLQKALGRAASTKLGTVVHWNVFLRAPPDQLIGGVTVQPWHPHTAASQSHNQGNELEFGYWCRTSMASQGYASEALSAVLKHAFSDLGAGGAWLRVAEDNVASLRLAKRLGFVEAERVAHPASPEWGDARTVLTLHLASFRLEPV